MSTLDNALHQIKVAKLQKAIEKNAGFWRNFTSALAPKNLGKSVGEGLLAAGTSAAITGIGLGVKAGVDTIREKVEKPRAFKGMMSAMPGLKKEDPRAVQMTFNTLYGMNRQMAKDPLVAGSFVAKHVNRADIGGEGGAYVDPVTVKTLRDARRGSPGEGPSFQDWMKRDKPKHASVDPDKLKKFREQLSKVRG